MAEMRAKPGCHGDMYRQFESVKMRAAAISRAKVVARSVGTDVVKSIIKGWGSEAGLPLFADFLSVVVADVSGAPS